MVLRLALVGAGGHCHRQHLPSLVQYMREHPGAVELAALCDLDLGLARRAAAEYGFAMAYADLGEMLASEELDACVAVTPIPVTAAVATQIVEAGIPLCMEKPPGASVAEANAVADLARERGVEVMVSVNRRFDPAITAMQAWWGEEPITYLRGCMSRVNRREDSFLTGTGIHALDTLRALGGDLARCEYHVRTVDAVCWYLLDLTFESGAIGVLEIAPTAGADVELYELSGANRRASATSAYKDAGWVKGWVGGELVLDNEPAEGEPEHVRAGSYAETFAFLDALVAGRPLAPTLERVIPSMEVCHAIEDAVKATASE